MLKHPLAVPTEHTMADVVFPKASRRGLDELELPLAAGAGNETLTEPVLKMIEASGVTENGIEPFIFESLHTILNSINSHRG